MLFKILSVIAPVFVCAGIGFAWGRTGRPFETRMVGALALNLGMPCLAFSALTRLNVSPTAFAEMVGAYGLVLACFLAIGLTTIWIMKVPAHTLVKLPDDLSFTTGAAISCGTGTAYGALKRLALGGDETIVIFGQGPVGLSGTRLAAPRGARVIAVDISTDRRQMALEKGVDVAIDPLVDDAVQAIKELTHGEGADKALDVA